MRLDIDVARFAAAVYDVPGRAAWRVRIGSRYVLGWGGIAPVMGTIDLLDAHAALVQEQATLADIRLVVIGPTAERHAEYQAEFWARAAEYGTTPVVLGKVRDADLPALVAGAAAAAYLPIDDDSADGSPLAALAAGVPVVARDLPAVRALLGDAVVYGDTVLSIADALVEVLTVPPEPGTGVELAATLAAARGAGDAPEPTGEGRVRRRRSAAAARSGRSSRGVSRAGPSGRRGPG